MRFILAFLASLICFLPALVEAGDLKTQRVFGGWRYLNGTTNLIEWSLSDNDSAGPSETGGHQPITNDIDVVGILIQGGASHAGSVGRIAMFRAQPNNNTQIAHCAVPFTIQEFNCWIPFPGKMRLTTAADPAIVFTIDGVGPNFVGNVSVAIHVYYEDAPAP